MALINNMKKNKKSSSYAVDRRLLDILGFVLLLFPRNTIKAIEQGTFHLLVKSTASGGDIDTVHRHTSPEAGGGVAARRTKGL